MKMQTTVVLLILFVVALGVMAILDVTNQPTTAELREQKDRVLPALDKVDKENVTKIEIAYKDKAKKALAFTRSSDDAWQMTAPVDVLADAGNVDSVVTDLKSLKRKERTKVITDTDAKVLTLSEFGLDAPTATVTLTTKDGQAVKLAVGGKTATEDGVYVMDLDETPKAVQVVESSGLNSFREKKLADFREKDLVQTSKWDADRFVVTGAKLALAGEKADGKWRLTKPVADAGDTSKIEDSVLSKIVDLKVDKDEDFVDDAPKDLKAYGLDKPALTLEVGKTKDKDGKKVKVVEKVLIGKALPKDKDKVYAMIAGQKNVVAVKKAILADMSGVKVKDLRDKSVVSVDKEKADRVEIARAGAKTPLVLERFEEAKKDDAKSKDVKWKVTKPQAYGADKSGVEDLLTKLNDLKAADFLDGKKAKDYGLAPAAIAITVREGKYISGSTTSGDDVDGSVKKTKTLLLGKPVPSKKKGEPSKQRYAMRSADAKTLLVVDVPDALQEKLSAGVLAYRDKSILEFTSDDAVKVAVQRDGAKFLMEKQKDKDGKDQWKLVQPVKADGDSGIGTLVSTAASLTAEKLVSEDSKTFAKYGVGSTPASARATITLKKAADDKKAAQYVILVGKKVKPDDDSSAYYARVAGQDLVFELSNWKAGDFLKEFRDTKMFEFKDDDLKKVTVVWPKSRIAATKDGDAYKLVEPRKLARFDVQKVKDIVSEMKWLKADSYAQYTGKPKAAWGLAKPRMTVELEMKDGAKHTVRFGAPTAKDKDKCYLSVAGFEPTAVVSQSFFKDFLGKQLRHFQKEEEKKPEAKKTGKSAATRPTATQPK